MTTTLRRRGVPDRDLLKSLANDGRLPDFMRHGGVNVACRDTDPELFWPVSRDNEGDIKRAKAVCARCALRPDCAEHGIEYEAWGIWGGLTEDERRLIRKERANAAVLGSGGGR